MFGKYWFGPPVADKTLNGFLVEFGEFEYTISPLGFETYNKIVSHDDFTHLLSRTWAREPQYVNHDKNLPDSGSTLIITNRDEHGLPGKRSILFWDEYMLKPEGM